MVWQKSCVCQHEDFTQNMLTLISGLQGPLGQFPFAFFSVPFVLRVCPEISDIPKFN